jgi:hypothetical protein
MQFLPIIAIEVLEFHHVGEKRLDHQVTMDTGNGSPITSCMAFRSWWRMDHHRCQPNYHRTFGYLGLQITTPVDTA